MNTTRKTKTQLIDELKIRDALDRVRAQALAMQTSDELAGVTKALFDEFKNLEFELYFTTINIIDREAESVQSFAASAISEEILGRTSEEMHARPAMTKSFEDHRQDGPRFDRLLESWNQSKPYELIHSNREDFVPGIRKGLTEQGISPERIERALNTMPSEDIYTHIVFYSHGMIGFTGPAQLTEEDLAVAKRFADIFDFAYGRFLELKQKEDQYRELTIQNALERVRSRALGMQKSEELSGVATALFDEFANLEFELFSVTVDIIDRDKEIMHDFTRSPVLNALFERSEKELQARPAHVLTFEGLRKQGPFFDLGLKTWDEGEINFLFQMERKELVQALEHSPPFQSLSPEKRAQLPEIIPESIYHHGIFFSQGWVNIQSPDKLSKEDLDICTRFTEAFDFAYGRFLELKQKEDQNRELTVQNALERVRSRALSMQTSDELAGVATALFGEFQNLGFELFYVSVNVIDRETETVQYFTAAPVLQAIMDRTEEELHARPAAVSTFEDLRKWSPNFDRSVEAWDKGEPYYLSQAEGEEFIQRTRSTPTIQNLSSEQREHFLETLPERLFGHAIFYSQGWVLISSPNPLSVADLGAAKRFADAFDFAYARFRELKEAEEQARESERRAAVDRVRAEATAMEGTEDIINVVKELWQGLHTQGLEHRTLSLQIEDHQTELFQLYLATQVNREGPLSFPESRLVQKDLLPGINLYRSEMALSMYNEIGGRTRIETKDIYSGLEQALPEIHRRLWGRDIPQALMAAAQQLVIPFNFGAINAYRGTPFTEEDLNLVEPFAEAVSLGFRRYFDFQQLEQQNRELEEANAQIQEATRLKSQFLATMSHELRTPMNAIIGFTRLVLRRAENLEDRQRENLEKVQLSADHLLSLINDILDLSKVEAGRVDIQATDFNVTPVIQNCCATVGPTLGKPGVQLIPDIQPNIPNIHTDEARLRQIIINLISNALKFTDNGEVRVTTRIIQTDLQISVSDTGIGIPADQLTTIFEEFRQVDGTSTRRHQGTGLGLAITKRLIELLGGHISVTSTIGAGSTFTLTIPTTYGDPLSSAAPVPLQPDASASGAPGRTIVSIDDDPNIAVLIRQELEDNGYTHE